MERNIIRRQALEGLASCKEGRAGWGNATDNGESTLLPSLSLSPPPHTTHPFLAFLKQSFQGIFARLAWFVHEHEERRPKRNAREGARFYALTCNIIAIHHYQAPFRERRYAVLLRPSREARYVTFFLLLDRLKASNRCFDVHR